MSSNWADVGTIFTIAASACGYLVHTFFFKRPHEKYSSSFDQARDAIHEHKFLPIIVSVCDSVVVRKGILPTAETVELVNEFSISNRLRGELVAVVAERIALDHSYGWARRLCPWVAISWLACIVFFVTLFWGHYDVQKGIKSLWVPSLAIPTIASAGVGCTATGLYLLALNRFLRLLRANPL